LPQFSATPRTAVRSLACPEDPATRPAGHSDGRFELLAAHSRDIILFIRASDGRILEANAAASRCYGYSRDELLGLGIFDLLADDAREWIECQMERANERGIFFEGEHRRKDGSVFPVEVSSEGAALDGERVLISVIRDITDRKRAEEEMREAALFAEQNPSPVLRVRRDGLVLFGNSAAALLLAASRCAVGEPAPEALRGVVDEAVAQGVKRELEIRCGDREISFEASPVPGRDYANLYGRDVTERNVAHRLLAQTKRRQELLAEVVGRLLASDDPQGIMDELARRVMGKLDCHVYSSFLVEEREGRLHLNACAGIDGETARTIEWLDFGDSVSGCAARDGCRVVAENIRETEDPRTELLRSNGIQAYACHPLLAGERVIGTLSFGSRTRTRFPEDDLALMQAVTHHIAIAMERVRAQRLLHENEARLQQSQKMESVAMLAGGIAHDFNNLLVGIIGNASLAEDLLPPGSPAAETIREVVKAGERAACLTREMLAYSGKGRFVVERVDLSKLVRDVTALFRSSVPNQVTLRLDLPDDLPPVEVDTAQVQQVVMNLVINAVQAIGDARGLISVGARLVDIDARAIAAEWGDAELRPGPHVRLEVRDNGCGMDEATKARMFDPFFTTKPAGRGLGLASVSGIVRGHKGAIKVESELGRGSLFSVLIPAARAGAVRPPRERAADLQLAGQGRILVVDDEEIVRNMAGAALERLGYEVSSADSGPAAVAALAVEPLLDLAILDLSMPGMSGQETLARLRAARPDLRIVVSSGYGEAECRALFQDDRIAGFLQKPYTATALGQSVKAAMTSA
jgi:PAS domain S-box-containing protein